MQMKKKTGGLNLHNSSQREKNVGIQGSGGGGAPGNNGTQRHNLKAHNALTSFKSAVMKCASVFNLFLSGKRKTESKVVESDDRKNAHKVRGASCKFDEKFIACLVSAFIFYL